MTAIFDAQVKFYEVERDFKWQEWMKKIPVIQFPSSWKVQIIPPFGAAMIRFRVVIDDESYVSVYLDCYGTLGGMSGHPYWEIYPAADGDTERFKMDDIEGLLESIKKSLKKWRKKSDV